MASVIGCGGGRGRWLGGRGVGGGEGEWGGGEVSKLCTWSALSFVDSTTNFSNNLKLNCQIPPISLFVSVLFVCLSLKKGRALKMCDVLCCLIKPTLLFFVLFLTFSFVSIWGFSFDISSVFSGISLFTFLFFHIVSS